MDDITIPDIVETFIGRCEVELMLMDAESKYVGSDNVDCFLFGTNIAHDFAKFTIATGNKRKRKDMAFIRIGTKSSSSYLKVTTQYNHQVLPPLIKIRQLTHLFLNSISTDI